MIHYVFSLCKKYRNKLQSADLYLQKGFGTLCAFTLRKIRLFRVRIYFFLMISCFSQSFNYWSFSCRIKGLPSTILVSISLCNQMVTCSSFSCLYCLTITCTYLSTSKNQTTNKTPPLFFDQQIFYYLFLLIKSQVSHIIIIIIILRYYSG